MRFTILATLMLVTAGTVDLSSYRAAISRECFAHATIVTSELSVQVYLIAPIGGGLLPAPDHEVIAHFKGREWSAKTDGRGFLRFRGLPPGEYWLHVPGPIMEEYYQTVRVTGTGSAPARTIAVVANVQCGGLRCVVEGAKGPLASPPRCLFTRKPRF